MKLEYFIEGSKDLALAKPTEYLEMNQIKVTKDGISYTKKGKSYAPLSPIERSLCALAALALSFAILPLAFGTGRKFIKQLSKEALYGREKTIYYVCSLKDTPQGRFFNTIGDKMKSEFKAIDEVSSATCFVKITRDGQSFIRQYIFANEDGTPINKIGFTGCIEKIEENLTKESPFVHSISQQWVIISKLPNGHFYVADGDRNFASKQSNGELQGGGGSCGGSWNKEGLNVALYTLKRMGMENKVWENNNFVRGTYFHDLTTSTPKVVPSSIDV